MKFKSLTSKLLLFIIASFILVIAGVVVIANYHLTKIIDKSQEEIFTEKINVIWENLDRSEDRLNQTGLREAYQNDFQTAFLSTMQSTYYAQSIIHIKPIILDPAGKILLHPSLHKGESLSGSDASINEKFADEQGNFYSEFSGDPSWYIYKKFEPWNWIILYAVPLEVKYRDKKTFTALLLATMFTVSIIVTLLLSIVIARQLRPIKTLTKITSEIAAGEMEKPILTDSHDEIATLAESFDQMRLAVKDQFHKLNLEMKEREHIEKELVELKQYLLDIINSMSSAIIAINGEKKITQWNISAEIRSGISAEKALSQPLETVCPELAQTYPLLTESIRERRIKKFSKQERISDENTIYEDITIFPLSTTSLADSGAVIRIDNVTKEYEFEQQISHRSKMDAIGQLAGGVAHDFNNMLSGILGAAQLIQRKTEKDQPNLAQMSELIIQACTRAADLTQKLLSFGRKGKIISTPLNIHSLITDTVELLSRTIDKKINMTCALEAKNTTIFGDGSGLQNVLMNIGINASHSMPDGGEFIIRTKNTWLDKMYCDSSPFDIEEGEYVQIEFEDSGCGIAPENIKKIFDPFFTTKEHGKGAGLGLAAAYGAIRDHSGIIAVESKLDKGTTFSVLLPCSESEAQNDVYKTEIVSGTGNVLLVDDEEVIRLTCSQMLEDMGYTVFVASNGKEAVDMIRESDNRIDVTIMDMIMPVMDGQKAIETIRSFDAEMKIIASSGFVKDAENNRLESFNLSGFLHKPYKISELSQLLKATLQN